MGKYFKYAIGEILLVVIGILIALSINNWNEDKKKRKAEIQFYKNTVEQLIDDKKSLKGQVNYTNLYLEQFNYAIKIIDENNIKEKDSLGVIALSLLNYSDFDRKGNIYETAVNGGDIKLLGNNEIINGLRRLEETYIYINRMETIHSEAVMSMVQELIQGVRFHNKKVENIDHLYSFQFQNLFAVSLGIMTEKNMIYENGMKQIDALNSLMDKEINND